MEMEQPLFFKHRRSGEQLCFVDFDDVLDVRVVLKAKKQNF